MGNLSTQWRHICLSFITLFPHRNLRKCSLSPSHEHTKRLLENGKITRTKRTNGIKFYEWFFVLLWRHQELFSILLKLFIWLCRQKEWMNSRFRIILEFIKRKILKTELCRGVQHLTENFAQLITFADKIEFRKQIWVYLRQKTESKWRWVNEIDCAITRRLRRHKPSKAFLDVTIWWMATPILDLFTNLQFNEIKRLSELTFIGAEVW